MNKALVRDLAKKRRDYLRKNVVANTGMGLGCGFTLLFGLMTIIATIWALMEVCFLLFSIAQGNRFDVWDTVFALIGLFILGLITFGSYKMGDASANELAFLVRVPPVAEQIAALPAQQVLVRGSNQPVALPDELLRAAHAGKVDPAEGLLRPEPTEEPLQQIGGRTA